MNSIWRDGDALAGRVFIIWLCLFGLTVFVLSAYHGLNSNIRGEYYLSQSDGGAICQDVKHDFDSCYNVNGLSLDSVVSLIERLNEARR